jgi:hypothetical protein
MFGLAFAGPAMGPGSWLTPGMAGERSVVKLTVGAACADDGRAEPLPAVAALAVATQENRTRAPTNNPTSTLRVCRSLKYRIVKFSSHLNMLSVDCQWELALSLQVLLTTVNAKV